MGCWNETCLFSRLPIACGDRIACVFIAPVDAWPETVYADSQYVPVSLPFRGRYDDYGRIEDIEYDAAALASLSDTAFWSQDAGEWSHVEVPGPGDKNWEDRVTELSDMARHGRLWVYNGTSANSHAMVRLAFVHLEFWDYAAKQMRSGASSDRLASLAYRWPVAKRYPRMANDEKDALAGLAAANAAMELMRVAWQPTCGTGHQAGIDYRWQAALYRKFADRASELFRSGQE